MRKTNDQMLTEAKMRFAVKLAKHNAKVRSNRIKAVKKLLVLWPLALVTAAMFIGFIEALCIK